MAGRYNGRQVVAEGVISEIRKDGDSEKFKANGQAMRAGYPYHNQWWVPHDRDGTFEMKGLNGQHVPSETSALTCHLPLLRTRLNPIGVVGGG